MKTLVAFALAVCLGTAPAGMSIADLPDPNEATFRPGSEIKAIVLKDFTRFDPQYVENRQRSGDRLDHLAKRLAALQGEGNEMTCSNQIYLEAKWLYHYTAYWDRLENGLTILQGALSSRIKSLPRVSRPKPVSGDYASSNLL